MPRLEHHQDTEMPGQNGYAEYVETLVKFGLGFYSLLRED